MEELTKAMEILEKLSFFGGQRAGRELWNDKPRVVQDEDIAAFNRDVQWLRDFIRKHMSDGWIPCSERMPTKEECENNYFWIMLKYNASPVIAKCDWIESENEKGNDDSFSEFFIDQYPQIYTPSKDIVIAWKIAGVPEPYHPERSDNHDEDIL